MAKTGEIIQGKYEILKLIGKGGMSKVYLAMDQNLNKQWAVKEIKKQENNPHNKVFIQSAMAEANMIKKLDHPSLPRIVDIINKEDAIYIVMDYIEGEPLSNILNTHGAMSQQMVIHWAIELCQVLGYLHTQTPPIIYRDMKPANIMLQPNGNIKLIDFGIAREYKQEGLSDTVSLGTKGYAAPEQFSGKGQTDARTDIYSLGVTLYHLLTGKNPCEPPYEIYPIRHWNPHLSSGLEYVIQKCTQSNPNERYQSCAELLYAFEHYNEMDESYRKEQKKRLTAFALSIVMVFVCLLIGGLCQILKNIVNNNDYDNNLQRAELSVNTSEKMDYYQHAIDIKPDEVQAYLGMVAAMKEDAVFQIEEEEMLKKKLNGNLPILQRSGQYGDLAFEIGKLYWYYYDYGKTENADNRITRMKGAIQWFEAACRYGGESSTYYETAQIYCEIGKFNRDITLNVQEASDRGMYLPYWENLRKLVDIINNSEAEQEIVNLEVYKLAMNAIETYARKFKSDGVAKEDMELLFEEVKTGTININTTTDKTTKMKEDIINQMQETKKAIDNAFADN